MNKPSITLLLILFLVISCKKETQKQDNNAFTKNIKNKGINVNTTVLQKASFNKQLIANGKIEAQQKSELRFKTNNSIASIKVKNGSIVNRGQIIAVLENTLLYNQLQKAKLTVQKAENKLEEEKINYFSSRENKELNQSILKNLEIKSGVLEAKNNLENAQIQYQQTFLKAPFSGIIANVKNKAGNFISTADVFCTLINPNKLEVAFAVLENEYAFIRKGQQITIQSFTHTDKVFKGVITEINPLVDKNGLIKLKATITSSETALFDGMHVKVFINHPIKNVLVVPKEALVLRSNKKVIFTLHNGLAKWNYVTELYQNSNYYAIKKGEHLKETDTIIVSGNLNLSHDAKVNATFIPADISKK